MRVTTVFVEPWQRGTLAYLAPEVLERGILSPAADCYAFGVLLYEMLTAEARPVCAVQPYSFRVVALAGCCRCKWKQKCLKAVPDCTSVQSEHRRSLGKLVAGCAPGACASSTFFQGGASSGLRRASRLCAVLPIGGAMRGRSAPQLAALLHAMPARVLAGVVAAGAVLELVLFLHAARESYERRGSLICRL